MSIYLYPLHFFVGKHNHDIICSKRATPFSDGRTTCPLPLSFDSFCTKTKSSFSKIKCARTTNNVYVFVNVATNPNKYVLNSYNIIQSNRFQNTNRR